MNLGDLTGLVEKPFAMDAARGAGDARAVRELEALAPYAAPGRRIPLRAIFAQRRWVEFYGGTMAYRRGSKADGDLADLSPDYGDAEIGHIWDGNAFAERYLLSDALGLDLSQIRRLDCPLIVFAGRHDFNVNSDLAAAWFATVESPVKQLVWFEHSAHMPMTEEPGKYLLSLVRHARPIAERAGDGPPRESEGV